MPEYPIVIDALSALGDIDSEQVLGARFDAWIYVAQTLVYQIAPKVRKKFQLSTPEERAECIVFSGENGVWVCPSRFPIGR